ncbi:MAG: hypothetical protein WB992_01575 [Bryobacteraceae bacterium]
MPYGFTDAKWAEGKAEITAILSEKARSGRGMITYGDLSREVRSIRIDPHEEAMRHMLGEISTHESKNGRGMLTVIVVHKHGDMEPGPGFYKCAESLGFDVSDRLAFWTRELHKVHAYWEKHGDQQNGF